MDFEAKKSMVDGFLDDVLPEELDWRDLVRTYPIPALVITGLGGFVLGSRHGSEILEGISSFVAEEVDRNVSTLLGTDRRAG